MKKEETIDVLNTLVEINNDRIEGYQTASKETVENDLKELFSTLAATSERCKSDLVQEIERLGGKATEGTRTTGKFYRVWMDVKAAATGKDRKAILSSCEFGEDVAVGTYAKAQLKDELDSDVKALIKSQYDLIKADHDRIKNLRDVLVEAR